MRQIRSNWRRPARRGGSEGRECEGWVLRRGEGEMVGGREGGREGVRGSTRVRGKKKNRKDVEQG